MTNRRKLTLAAVATVALASAIVFPLVFARTPQKARVVVYRPPSTINATCASDDTRALETWLTGLPDGTAGHLTTVDFAKGCYQVDGELYFRGLRYFEFEGGTFKQMAAPTKSETDVPDVPTIAPYCGSTAFENSSRTEDGEGAVIMFHFEGGCDILMKNMRLYGTYAGTGGGPFEQDSFVGFDGTQVAEVDDVTMRGTWGDFVDAQALHECGSCFAQYPATDITVTDSKMSLAGRVGVGIVAAERVTVTDSTFARVATTVFDVEIDCVGCSSPDGTQSDITIEHNVVNRPYAYVLAVDTAGKVENLQLLDDQVYQLRVVVNPGTMQSVHPSSGLRVSGITAQKVDSAQAGRDAAVQVTEMTDVEVDDNSVPVGKPGIAKVPTGSVVCQNAGLVGPGCPIAPVVSPPVFATLP